MQGVKKLLLFLNTHPNADWLLFRSLLGCYLAYVSLGFCWWLFTVNAINWNMLLYLYIVQAKVWYFIFGALMLFGLFVAILLPVFVWRRKRTLPWKAASVLLCLFNCLVIFPSILLIQIFSLIDSKESAPQLVQTSDQWISPDQRSVVTRFRYVRQRSLLSYYGRNDLFVLQRWAQLPKTMLVAGWPELCNVNRPVQVDSSSVRWTDNEHLLIYNQLRSIHDSQFDCDREYFKVHPEKW